MEAIFRYLNITSHDDPMYNLYTSEKNTSMKTFVNIEVFVGKKYL